MGQALLTAAQVAQMLGVPKTWVYEQSRMGRIPTVTLGRYRRYRAEAIAEWVQKQEAEGSRGGISAPHRAGATRNGADSRRLPARS
jgi:excisionase family DNA binding protein